MAIRVRIRTKRTKKEKQRFEINLITVWPKGVSEGFVKRVYDGEGIEFELLGGEDTVGDGQIQ